MAMFYNFGREFDADGNERPCTGCPECRPQRAPTAFERLTHTLRILKRCGCLRWEAREAGCRDPGDHYGTDVRYIHAAAVPADAMKKESHDA